MGDIVVKLQSHPYHSKTRRNGKYKHNAMEIVGKFKFVIN
jgi:hypothetical protein